ncbi:MAG: hypothetical protein ABW161_06685 [Candidatus Thiodiazotropha sp.]
MKNNQSIISLDSFQAVLEASHPAAVWAETATLDPSQVDCVTAVMLKILDNKCKMGLEEQLALMAVYSVLSKREGLLFDDSVHQIIAQAKQQNDQITADRIHELRLHAESVIPKQVMKCFKQYLRESLFGLRWSI